MGVGVDADERHRILGGAELVEAQVHRQGTASLWLKVSVENALDRVRGNPGERGNRLPWERLTG